MDELAMRNVNQFLGAVNDEGLRAKLEGVMNVVVFLSLVAGSFSLEEGDDAADGGDQKARHFALEA